ncbi:alanine dehydrogenase [Pseudobacteriovorax antillogorgiicola]|uniref:Alanine dehydrogenase n=1 Tax=Pseudobacteriovorax antillogorgiicola TaxID=1513793 RepID=A0A1Y6B3W0_9BACT|nr:alanine dehydrogenase [Pseudobacteriovorax antillogorgiicola]TCS59470.1 L-alanine dehydrogenase [Pseudobacteriovorax antillogorgiicola]SME88058.1 alanine dehydrogenase [Pseudobacteriovorax antillogorgiicola]
MIIGVPKEVKNRENRVAVVPGGVKMFTAAGHEVLIQQGAGLGAGITDEEYKLAGAKILPTAGDVWGQAEMIMKVKEPIAEEFPLMREGQILYTYLHLAAAQDLGHELVKRKVSAIAYETIQLPNGALPLLTPMSEVAGRMSVQVGAQCLQKHRGGKGLLLGGVPGVRRGRVTIIGGGVVGINAAKMAIGLGARVTMLDVNAARLAYLDDVFGTDIDTLMSNPENISKSVEESDLVVGAVLIAGAKAPCLVNREMIATMERNSAVVDVAIDQGGCIETIKPTTHDDPVFVEEDVIHYGVTNIPGDVPRTSTYALTNVTHKYAMDLANKGLEKALALDPALKLGLNTFQGIATYRAVAEALGLDYQDINF